MVRFLDPEIVEKVDKSYINKGFVDLFYAFRIQKFSSPFLQFLDPETEIFLRFLDPETAPFLLFLDPEIFWSIFTLFGSRDHSICLQFLDPESAPYLQYLDHHRKTFSGSLLVSDLCLNI